MYRPVSPIEFPDTEPRPVDADGRDGGGVRHTDFSLSRRYRETPWSMRCWRARWLILLALVVVIGVLGYTGPALLDFLDPEVPVEQVIVPPLSAAAQAGGAIYERRCSQCHGLHGAGGATGPPLVHPIYRPAHHGDVAFELAVRRGVRAHHWRAGDMPAQADVSPGDVEAITGYIRELQRANGIE